MESNKSEINIGDFVLTQGTLCEILAVHEMYSGFTSVKRYSICYASAENETCMSIQEDLLLENLNINKRADISEVTIPVTEAKDVPKSKYGNAYEMAQRLLERSRDRYEKQTLVSDLMMRKVNGYVRAKSAVTMHSPEPLEDKISLFRNATDRKRNRRSAMKPGRAFKHMLETSDEKEISSLTEAWIQENLPREFILKEGETRKDFRRAYCGTRAQNRNVKSASRRKALATSCMHAIKVESEVEGEDMSPAEVFASGDFKVAWLETTDGKIAARVVYSNKEGRDRTSAPIYGVCEQSINELEKHLESQFILPKEDWKGLLVLQINTQDGQVGPYMDCDIRGEEVGSEWIELCWDGRIKFASTDGYSSDGVYCEDCSDVVDEDDMVDVGDRCVCMYCFEQGYVLTENDVILPIDEVVEAYYFTGNLGGDRTMLVHMDDAVYIEDLEEDWHVDYVTVSDCGVYVPSHLVKDYPELFPDEEE